MNDLDLRAALHRDAELAGEPSPDLLDQLALRSDKQRRQRAGLLATALAVVVIAAGIPVGQSLLAQGDPSPVDQAPVPTTPEVPPTPSAAPTTVVDPSPSPEPEAPRCPDSATLMDIVNVHDEDPFVEGESILVPGPAPTLCSADGDWAWPEFIRYLHPEGQGRDSALFRLVDGAWVPQNRVERCSAGDVPADIWAVACSEFGAAPSATQPAKVVSAAEYYVFSAPSGNISCGIGQDHAHCQIRESSFEQPARPSDCEFDYGEAITVGGEARAEFVCISDTPYHPGNPVLAYGERITNGVVTCASATTGMSCATASGAHGFELSRASYRLY